MSLHNVLRDIIMNIQHICLHLFKPCHLYFRLQRWILPDPVQYPPGMPPSDPPIYPVLKHPQGPYHAGVHHPHICPKTQYRLHQFLEKHPCHTWIRLLPSQEYKNMRPAIPCLPQVPRRRRKIFIGLHNEILQVLEGF